MIWALMATASPLILAALGGLLSERSGVLNIALEGCIAAGAFITAVLVISGLPPGPAMVAAMIGGGLFGLLLAGAHLYLGANLFIAGLGVNLLIPSLISLVSQLLYGHKGALRLPVDALEAFTGYGMRTLSIIVIPLAAGIALMLYRSEYGRRLRSAAFNPEFLVERNISVQGVRTSALMVSSALAAMAGSFIALRVGAWVPGLSAGRGWIALVIIWLGFRRPAGIVLASYLFSISEIISGRIQGSGDSSATLFLALPYFFALTALTLAAMGNSGNRRR